jgi:anti-sigma factor RsiW
VSPHLGDEVAAFVDGQLDYARRERALAHLSRCTACRSAVEQHRRIKVRVQTLPGAEPSAALLFALTRVSGEPVPCVPASASASPQSRAARGLLLLAGAGTVAAGVIGLAYIVGGAAEADPRTVSPPVARFHTEFAGAEQPVPLSDPAMDAFPVVGSRVPLGGR